MELVTTITVERSFKILCQESFKHGIIDQMLVKDNAGVYAESLQQAATAKGETYCSVRLKKIADT